ncbi:hypothetical protein FRC07_007485 [Ceratobasidium sp. 392]|nr:hypothetical protein FRC07_007485 [Ceratobasidium sp. 392]
MQSHIAYNQPVFANPHVKPFERLAADKPGEELAPGGVIWQMYVEEAKEYDSELVETENNNIDMMLLFAALFSAILTSFIIESKVLLQENSTDLTVTLLLAIAQSQQRMEQGTSQALPPIERPPFVASASARCINGLWFTSLALSLAAGLVAMLAKEWLTAFTASRPRPAYTHALVHQARLQGLTQWRALHIVNLLPTMLHLSLLLFFLGLAVYLWTLDSGIAIAEVAITAATVCFYTSTTLLGALRSSESCPFITQISKYLRAILVPSLRVTGISAYQTNPTEIDPGQVTSENELQALLWLTENARDPAVGDCACHALAGFRNSQPFTQRPSFEPTQDFGAEVNSAESISPIQHADENAAATVQDEALNNFAHLTPSRYELIKNLFDVVCTRFSQAKLRLPQESAENGGMHMARYISLMPTLAHALEENQKVAETTSKGNKASNWRTADSPTVTTFRALGTVWINQFPELSPDSYATLTAAELRLTRFVATTQPEQHSLPVPQRGASGPDAVHAEITMQSAGEFDPSNKTSLFKLQARYSRALSRAGYLLRYHNTHRQLINTQPLIYLLDNMREAALCANLNPESHMSTCFPQSIADGDRLPEFQVQVASGGSSHVVKPLYIGDEDGIIAGLVQVLSAAGVEGNSPVELAAGSCLAVIGPMLLNQWVQMMDKTSPHLSGQDPNVRSTIEALLVFWPGCREMGELEGVVKWVLTQLLVITAISLALAAYPEMWDLHDIATTALCRRVKTEFGREAMSEMLADSENNVLSKVITFVEPNRGNISSRALRSLVEVFLTQNPDPDLSRNITVAPSWLPQLLRIVSCVPKELDMIQRLLDNLRDLVRGDYNTLHGLSRPYGSMFFGESEGFSSLASLAEQRDYVPATVDTIISVIHDATEGNSRFIFRRIRLGNRAVAGLLSSVEVVVNSVSSGTKEPNCLEPFMSEIMALLRPLDQSEEITAEHRDTVTAIYRCLRNISELPPEVQDLLFELEDWSNEGDGLLRGLDRLFDDGWEEAVRG